ncbi:hypothetical protein PROFUN_09454 [Planoprotostelium fungivorum]|uniref:Uncharacterized protein n=1 Tax=Planoprotostelium fungivorum TaxID=1890364 RepID=A0A2P6NH34_9EUKA|nr:hypothetical protein PROFUN_09454 [Planoprotostelium fungivorum]
MQLPFASFTLLPTTRVFCYCQTQVLSRMSTVCGVCCEAKLFVPIEHANDANPTVWTVVPGHQICSNCALDLELDQRLCPFCHISHDK